MHRYLTKEDYNKRSHLYWQRLQCLCWRNFRASSSTRPPMWCLLICYEYACVMRHASCVMRPGLFILCCSLRSLLFWLVTWSNALAFFCHFFFVFFFFDRFFFAPPRSICRRRRHRWWWRWRLRQRYPTHNNTRHEDVAKCSKGNSAIFIPNVIVVQDKSGKVRID